MKFSYYKFPLTPRSEFFGNYILKPIIPIKVSGGNNSLNYAALIDSGADFCIFDAEIGEALGIDIKSVKGEIFGGIQERGGAEAFFHAIKIDIGGWEYETKIGFSYDIAKHGYGILGQKGFFDIFMVKFDYSKAEVELKGK